MKNINKRKAFTLIELITVLVILALLALIVTPLVMNIVKKVKDSANKRSVDGYGKAVELALSTYLLDNLNYPNDLDELDVEYRGNQVICRVKVLNDNGSIYLSECSVNGVEVKDDKNKDGYYHYGKIDGYLVGDLVTYNGINFYVLSQSEDSVTLLKESALTIEEVNAFGVDSNGVNYINKNTSDSVGTAYSIGDIYGGVAYYTSDVCYYNDPNWNLDGCKISYDESDIKHIVDNWTNNNITSIDLKEDNLGYKARLITKEEYVKNCEVQFNDETGLDDYIPKYTWLYNGDYWYWTMSGYDSSNFEMWSVSNGGGIYNNSVYGFESYAIRPVITLLKSSLK